jgi:hypothetical protein
MTRHHWRSITVDHHWLWKASRIILTLILLTMLIAPTLPVNSAPSGPQGTISADEWAKMSTPARINSAFERGVIDGETRILYLAYAVNAESQLPKAYQGSVGWYGTATVRELYDVYNSVAAQSLSAHVARELDRFYGPEAQSAATFCDKEDGDMTDTTSSTYFTINYASSGANAIGGGLNLAQYVTALDTSYNGIVNVYGWAKPPVCGQTGIDCSGATVPGNKYPVQIFDLGSSLFGYVAPSAGSYAGWQMNDNPYTGQTETASVTSCMVLNSNFAQLGDSALGNLNGTASHEFVHAIQNAWGDPGEPMAAMWAESTAAYFEDEIFDSANSQYIYLYGDFNKNSLKDWKAGTAGQKDYENLVFFRYIAEQYGGANSSSGGEKVIQKFFENVATSSPAVDQELASFKAAVESFALGGGTGSSVFEDVFHNFAIATKFMKDCQDEAGYGNAYCYEEGTDYRASENRNFAETGGVPAVAGAIGSTTGSITGTVKSDYGIAWVRLPAKGNPAYKIDLSASTTTAMKASVVCDTGSAFTLAAFPQLISGTTAQSLASFNPAACNDVVLVITNQMESAAGAASAAHGYTVQLGVATNLDQHIYLPMVVKAPAAR